MISVREVISKLKLKPLEVEGGFFIETYRSEERHKNRSLSTAIYYLITRNNFSHIHRIKSDEVFHFYAGSPVEMICFMPDSKVKKIMLGNDLKKGHLPQVIVKKNIWQGAKLAGKGEFALLGTTVAPGFDYRDYENAKRAQLIKKYPKYKKLITGMTSE